MRAALAVTLTVLTAGLALPACTNDTDRFCGKLREIADLSGLSRAIETRDERKIVANLEALREVQDVAPEEIFADFRALVDALSGVVRIVTNAPDETGAVSQVDPTALTQQLRAIEEPAHNVSDFADRNCGITLAS